MKLSAAVQESTKFVAKGTAAASAVMLLVFLHLHLVIPQVPFDAGVVISGVLGCAVAAGNFFLMALVAEKAAADDNYDNAKRKKREVIRFYGIFD